MVFLPSESTLVFCEDGRIQLVIHHSYFYYSILQLFDTTATFIRWPSFWCDTLLKDDSQEINAVDTTGMGKYRADAQTPSIYFSCTHCRQSNVYLDYMGGTLIFFDIQRPMLNLCSSHGCSLLLHGARSVYLSPARQVEDQTLSALYPRSFLTRTPGRSGKQSLWPS